MAHVKALNKAKKSIDDGPESPHHTPITGRGRNGDSDDDDPVTLFLHSETHMFSQWVPFCKEVCHNCHPVACVGRRLLALLK